MNLRIEEADSGWFLVSGPLGFDTVTHALEISTDCFAHHQVLEIDFAGVTACDSAGLALLLEWVARASKKQQEIWYHNIPARLIALAQISEIDQILSRHTGPNKEPSPDSIDKHQS